MVEFKGIVTVGALQALLEMITEYSSVTDPFVTRFEAIAVTLKTPKKLKSEEKNVLVM